MRKVFFSMTGLSILIGFLVMFGCSQRSPQTDSTPTTSTETKIVIGIEGPVDLYEDQELAKVKGKIGSDDDLTILDDQGGAVHVKTKGGQEGWFRRCWICTSKELERRKEASEIPKNCVCIGAKGEKKFLYGGSLNIENNQFVVKPGDSFWLDPSMKGKEFSIAGEKVIGDPSVLLFKKEGAGLVKLQLMGQITTGNKDEGQPDAKQPEIKQSDVKQSDVKQSDVKQPDAEQPDTKQSDKSLRSKLPSNFPGDVPLYPGMEISGAAPIQGLNQCIVYAKTKDSKDKVYEYYVKHLTENGWKQGEIVDHDKEKVAPKTGTGVVGNKGKRIGIVTYFRKDDRILNLMVGTPKGEDTIITISTTLK